MRLQFLGATDTVTGSRTLVQEGGASVLVDCGLFQGWKQLRLRNWAPPPLQPAALDAVILTHAHIDHSGYLPLLVKNGFRGPIHCSAATADLCRILLPDSAHLLEEEADFANRHGTSKHQPALPLYTQQDVERCLRLLRPQPWDSPWQAAPGLQARLSPSGHMPGSSFVHLAGARTSILFSGDIGRPHDPVLRAPAVPPAAEHLVVESTYGDRLHARSDVLEELAAVVQRTAARGGVVVIPAFAVGRAQSLLHCLAQLRASGRIPALPVFLNSPMAAKANAVFLRHPDQLRLTPAESDAMAGVAEIVETPDASRALNARRGPMVIIAGSGMATGGRVVHHLKAFAPDRRNTILLAGFQAGGTRGAALAGGASTIRIHGEDIPVRAEVAMLGHLSAHADAAEILAWLRSLPQAPRTTFINHGEPAASDALRQRIERELHWRVHLPWYLEAIDLQAA
ncbi:MAG: MBL fold metallo-hydrolase RNA specificity domain-containing protein [Ramlibacter sp.]